MTVERGPFAGWAVTAGRNAARARAKEVKLTMMQINPSLIDYSRMMILNGLMVECPSRWFEGSIYTQPCPTEPLEEVAHAAAYQLTRGDGKHMFLLERLDSEAR